MHQMPSVRARAREKQRYCLQNDEGADVTRRCRDARLTRSARKPALRRMAARCLAARQLMPTFLACFHFQITPRHFRHYFAIILPPFSPCHADIDAPRRRYRRVSFHLIAFLSALPLMLAYFQLRHFAS
jgi:hypothetical protein